MANSREKLVEKARVEYGIVNAEDMSDTQLKQEIKALDDQRPSEQPETAKSSDTESATSEDSSESTDEVETKDQADEQKQPRRSGRNR